MLHSRAPGIFCDRHCEAAGCSHFLRAVIARQSADCRGNPPPSGLPCVKGAPPQAVRDCQPPLSPRAVIARQSADCRGNPCHSPQALPVSETKAADSHVAPPGAPRNDIFGRRHYFRPVIARQSADCRGNPCHSPHAPPVSGTKDADSHVAPPALLGMTYLGV